MSVKIKMGTVNLVGSELNKRAVTNTGALSVAEVVVTEEEEEEEDEEGRKGTGSMPSN